jgi:hypothetical protein
VDRQQAPSGAAREIALSLIALAAVLFAHRNPTIPPRVRVALAVAILFAAVVCFTTVGRLWYVPGPLLIVAAVFCSPHRVARRAQQPGDLVEDHPTGFLSSERRPLSVKRAREGDGMRKRRQHDTTGKSPLLVRVRRPAAPATRTLSRAKRKRSTSRG